MTPDDGQNGPRAKPPEIPNESNEGPRPLASKPDPEPTDVEPDPEPTDVEPLRRVLLWTLATLAFSAGLQLAFYRHGGVTALSDIPGRYRYWSLSLHNLPYIDAHVEYPVTIGYLTFVVSLLTTSTTWAFILNSALNSVLALTMTALLRVPGGKQIWRWVIGTPLLFYAFHNWDLWAMVPAVIGIYAYSKNRDALAGSTLAVGASAKLFPGLFLPPFIIMRWFSGDRRGAIRLTLWAGIVTVLLNGPIAIASPTGWAYPVKFQGARSASWGTVWEWFDRIPGIKSLVSTDPAAIANKVSILVLGLGLIAITVLAVRRNLSAVAVAAAATALFLLSNKIYSPTYDLWMVPFFVLLAIPRRVWLAYCAADIGVFVLVFGRFHGFWEAQAVVNSLWLFVFLRAATLVFVIFIALRSTAPSSPDLGTMWDHVRTPAGGPNR